MTTLFFILLFLYLSVLFTIALGFLVSSAEIKKLSAPQSGVSIIICMRNEAQHLAECLQSVFSQNYDNSLVQLILVDDDSQDQTADIAENLLKTQSIDHLLIRNTKRIGKKLCISKAISMAKHKLILVRDADTRSPHKEWLNTMLSFQKKGNYDLVIGPVLINSRGGLLSELQQIENNILQLLSAGTAALKHPFLCSGANLLFTRSAFESVNGFSSHAHIESGDDVLFLEDLKKTGKARIAYLKSKEAQVLTYPENTWTSLLRQKTRWASKFRYNPNPFNTFLASLVFVVNLIWILMFLYPFIFFHFPFSILLFILIKSGADLFLLFLSRSFMPIQLSAQHLFLTLIVYPFYAFVIGLRSLFTKPVWS